MKREGKLIAIAAMLMLSMGFSALANAAETANVTVKVTVAVPISVSVDTTELVLGTVAINGAVVSTTPITVTNNGGGLAETYSLSLSNPSGWTASGSAPGAETYVLDAAFSGSVSGITWNEANHALSTIAVASSATKFAGDQTGLSVPNAGVRKLWFKFKAPASTAVTTEQGIAVTITAAAG